MRCFYCESFSFKFICKNCELLLQPSYEKRVINAEFYVYCFYKYSEISKLLHTKHTLAGAFIYKKLTKLSIAKFLQDFSFTNEVLGVGIDDYPKNGYSHSAIIAKNIKMPNYKAFYGGLRARNKVKYSGKSLKYRLNNPRDFICKIPKNSNVILIDDIITTGTTFHEAYKVLKKNQINPLFGLVLANAKDN